MGFLSPLRGTSAVQTPESARLRPGVLRGYRQGSGTTIPQSPSHPSPRNKKKLLSRLGTDTFSAVSVRSFGICFFLSFFFKFNSIPPPPPPQPPFSAFQNDCARDRGCCRAFSDRRSRFPAAPRWGGSSSKSPSPISPHPAETLPGTAGDAPTRRGGCWSAVAGRSIPRCPGQRWWAQSVEKLGVPPPPETFFPHEDRLRLIKYIFE